MNLFTQISIPHAQREISHNDKILFLGSCFSQHIYQKMYAAGFQVYSNPFGVLYNPLSILRCVQILTDNDHISNDDFVQNDGLWFSLMHHGSFSATTLQELQKIVNTTIENGKKQLQQATVVIITLGTAYIYQRNQQVVSNCHKLPQNQFNRQRLTITQTTNALKQLIELLPDKQIIFTVSPIRHLNDGLHQNQLSKSTLLLAIDQLNNNALYFPAYEILIDELRDYRFYNDDLLHPSDQAVQIIYNTFQQTFFSKQTIQQAQSIEQLYNALQHKVLHHNSQSYQNFRQNTLSKLNSIKENYNWIDFSTDLLI